MDKLQKDILEIFKERSIVRQKISMADVEELQISLVPLEDITVYYNRNHDLLIDARVQVEIIEEATELVEWLKIDEIPDEKVAEEELEEDEIEEPLEEETIETVQETNSKAEKTSDQNSTFVVENNNRTNTTQPQPSTNNRTEASQLNKKTNSPSKSPSNNSSKDQSSNQSSTTEQKVVVAKQYQETAVIKKIHMQL